MRRGRLVARLTASVLAVGVAGPMAAHATTEPEPLDAARPVATLAAEALQTVERTADVVLGERIETALADRDTATLEPLLTASAQLRGTVRAHVTTLLWTTTDDLRVRHMTDVLDEDRRFSHEVATWAAGWFADELADDRVFEAVYEEDGQPAPLERLARSSSDLQNLSTVRYRAEDLWQQDTGEPLSFVEVYLTPYRETVTEARERRESAFGATTDSAGPAVPR